MADDGTLDAGRFGEWHDRMLLALAGDVDAEVPCGSCTACCESGQFVHIGPDETDTLALVPVELQFPAPGRPGHVVLPYDEHGRCPMLVEGRCSIYAHRPRTCRTFDCRIFAAAGVEPDHDKPLIAQRTSRWRFDASSTEDRERLEAIRTEAARLGAAEDGPDRPRNRTELAVRAVAVRVGRR